MKYLIILSSAFLWISLASCAYTLKVQDGPTAYELKQYAVAVDMLKKEYKKSKSRVEKGKIAYMLGDSYKNLNQSSSAIDWFKIAYDNQYGIDALVEYAYALKAAELYKEARQAFIDLGFEIGSPYEYRREVNACETALQWRKNEQAAYKIRLAEFNTSSADYSPVVFGQEALVITSDRASSTGEDTYNWTGNAFSDLFVVNLNDLTVSGFETGLNTEGNEGTVTFNKDQTEIFFTRCHTEEKWVDAYCLIYSSQKQPDGGWSVPEPLPFQEANVNYGHPALSEDGKTLYYASNHPDGWGGYDIWHTSRGPDGWSQPLPMSRTINTQGDEKFPMIDADTLYFSSNHHTGMGGLDIFKSYKLNNRSWSPAYNLLPPINSGADDFGFVIDRRFPVDGDVIQRGYFTSNRANGFGNDDIYQFEKVNLPEPEEPEVAEEDYKLILNGFVLEKIFEVPDEPNSRLLGRKPLDGASVTITYGEMIEKIEVGEDGYFTLELEEETDYSFLASQDGFLNNEATFTTRGVGRDPNRPVQEFEIEIVLDKVYKEREITLENIYYDFDRWEIRTDAQPTLNELARLLKLNPERRIQLGSHTDCRGNNRYNQELSQRRAQSAVDYLISRGISPNRLLARGYGEEEPAIDCICARCTEEEHQENRRTTFMFIE